MRETVPADTKGPFWDIVKADKQLQPLITVNFDTIERAAKDPYVNHILRWMLRYDIDVEPLTEAFYTELEKHLQAKYGVTPTLCDSVFDICENNLSDLEF